MLTLFLSTPFPHKLQQSWQCATCVGLWANVRKELYTFCWSVSWVNSCFASSGKVWKEKAPAGQIQSLGPGRLWQKMQRVLFPSICIKESFRIIPTEQSINKVTKWRHVIPYLLRNNSLFPQTWVYLYSKEKKATSVVSCQPGETLLKYSSYKTNFSQVCIVKWNLEVKD